MKKVIYLFAVIFLFGRCEEDNFSIPRDENGEAVLTDVSSATTSGVSTLDDEFTVNATFPNAKSGDVMNVECLQLQVPSGGSGVQLLPLSGTGKTATVGNDLKASVSYSRAEANLVHAGDYVTVVFSGATDYAKQKVDLVTATKTTKPKVGEMEVSVVRNAETAYFEVTVDPKSETYSGTLVAKRKNGKNSSYTEITGSPFSGTQPFKVPVSGNDFAAGKDTMYFSFIAAKGSYTDEIQTMVIVRDPYFFLKKSASLVLESANQGGLNMLTNTGVAENHSMAMLSLSNSLMFTGGSQWLANGHTIEFVPSTLGVYSANNSNTAIAAFNAGTKSATANPIAGEGVYIFKAVSGTKPEDVYFGMIKVTGVVPNVSVSFEYRIGNMYAHLAVIK